MAQYFKGTPIPGSTANIAASASSGGGADAKITFAAPASSGIRNVLTSVAWSYSTAPSSGALRVYSGSSSGSLICELDITAQGPDGWQFEPLGATPGAAMTVILTQAGSSVVGRLNAYGRTE